MTEFVRAVAPNGSHVSVSKAFAERHKMTVLKDHEAVDKAGRTLPAKHKTTPAKGNGDMTVAQLKDAIDKRNEGRDEADLIPTSGTKADLIAALEADDAR